MVGDVDRRVVLGGELRHLLGDLHAVGQRLLDHHRLALREHRRQQAAVDPERLDHHVGVHLGLRQQLVVVVIDLRDAEPLRDHRRELRPQLREGHDLAVGQGQIIAQVRHLAHVAGADETKADFFHGESVRLNSPRSGVDAPRPGGRAGAAEGGGLDGSWRGGVTPGRKQ